MSTVKAAMWPTRCGLCGGWIGRGAPIARHPSPDNRQRWGHPSCVGLLRADRPREVAS